MTKYDTQPVVAISAEAADCLEGWREVLEAIRSRIPESSPFVVAVELYPGIDAHRVADRLASFDLHATVLLSEAAFLSPAQLRETFASTLTEDPVFNILHPWTIESYLDPALLEGLRSQIAQASTPVIVVGAGAAHVVKRPDLLLQANVARWELQRRQRAQFIGNLGFDNQDASPGELYKIAFFLDWRVGDETRHRMYRTVDFFLDFNQDDVPRMLEGNRLRDAVRTTVERPFRVVPFFDPGPTVVATALRAAGWTAKLCLGLRLRPGGKQRSSWLWFPALRAAGYRPRARRARALAWGVSPASLWPRVPDTLRPSRHGRGRQSLAPGSSEHDLHP